jgi:hypothetical protein
VPAGCISCCIRLRGEPVERHTTQHSDTISFATQAANRAGHSATPPCHNHCSNQTYARTHTQQVTNCSSNCAPPPHTLLTCSCAPARAAMWAPQS